MALLFVGHGGSELPSVHWFQTFIKCTWSWKAALACSSSTGTTMMVSKWLPLCRRLVRSMHFVELHLHSAELHLVKYPKSTHLIGMVVSVIKCLRSLCCMMLLQCQRQGKFVSQGTLQIGSHDHLASKTWHDCGVEICLEKDWRCLKGVANKTEACMGSECLQIKARLPHEQSIQMNNTTMAIRMINAAPLSKTKKVLFLCTGSFEHINARFKYSAGNRQAWQSGLPWEPCHSRLWLWCSLRLYKVAEGVQRWRRFATKQEKGVERGREGELQEYHRGNKQSCETHVTLQQPFCHCQILQVPLIKLLSISAHGCCHRNFALARGALDVLNLLGDTWSTQSWGKFEGSHRLGLALKYRKCYASWHITLQAAAATPANVRKSECQRRAVLQKSSEASKADL